MQLFYLDIYYLYSFC